MSANVNVNIAMAIPKREGIEIFGMYENFDRKKASREKRTAATRICSQVKSLNDLVRLDKLVTMMKCDSIVQHILVLCIINFM